MSIGQGVFRVVWDISSPRLMSNSRGGEIPQKWERKRDSIYITTFHSCHVSDADSELFWCCGVETRGIGWGSGIE